MQLDAVRSGPRTAVQRVVQPPPQAPDLAPHRDRDRHRHWPAVQRCLGTLPTPLLQQAMLLCHDLVRTCSDDGTPQGLLARPWDAPLFDQAGWLLDDWGVPHSGARAAFEAGLHLATTFSLLASRARCCRHDLHSAAGTADAPLVQALADLAAAQWRALFADDSPFWDHHRRALQAALPIDTGHAPTVASAASHLPWLPVPAVAAALWAGRAGSVPLLCRCNLLCAEVLQAVAQLASHRQDVVNSRPNPTLQRALDAMPPGPRNMPGVEAAQAALLLTGTLSRVLRENEQRIAALRDLAGDLQLPSLQAHADTLALLMQQLRGLFGLKMATTRATPLPPGGFFLPATALLRQVMARAEARLLGHPGLSGTRDTPPALAAGAQDAGGSVLAASLVLDVLQAHGHDMRVAARRLLQALPVQGLRERTHLDLLVTDADDLATALRLVRLARRPARERASLVALAWDDTAVLPGATCATVQAHLLLSLDDSDWAAHHGVVQAAARHWCSRWLAVGLGGCERYPPLYSLWTATELVSRLQAQATDIALRAQLRQVLAALSQRLEAEARRSDLGPQDAAFLLLASQRARALPFDPAWVQLLCRHQRPDGGWNGEPIRLAPAGDGLCSTWDRSSAMTTAFIFHALKHHPDRHLQRPATATGGPAPTPPHADR